MSSIHYKFKSMLEYKTLTFNGLNISVEELKRLVSEKENIRIESFDLKISNAHTKREYNSEDLVPRNSSVIVQRIPRENALKLPKVHDTSTSGIVGRSSAAQSARPGYIPSENFSKMSEDQRLAHIKGVSYEKYSPANYSRRPSASLSIPPPPTYVCNRCSNSGHWSQKCPLLNIRRTTGIPFEELVETTKDDPNALLHPSGKFVVPIMHAEARRNRKKETLFDPSQAETTGGGSPAQQPEEERAAPSELACSICKSLLRDAVLAICCGDSFCADCIQQKVLEDSQQRCPGGGCVQQISTDSLVPNNKMRLAVQKFLSNQYSKTDNPPAAGASSGLLHKLLPDLVVSSTSASASSQPSTTSTASTSVVNLSDQKPPPSSPKAPQGVMHSSTPTPSSSGAPPPSIPLPTSAAPASLGGLAAKPMPFSVNFSVPPPPIPSRVASAFAPMSHPPPRTQLGMPTQQQSHSFPPPTAGATAHGVKPLHPSSAPQRRQLDQGINDAWDAFLRRKDEVGPRKACELTFLSDIQDKLRKQTSLHPPGAESPKNSPSSGSSRSSSSSPSRSRHSHHHRHTHHPYRSRRREPRRGHSPSPPIQYRREYPPSSRGASRRGRGAPARLAPTSRRITPPPRTARKDDPSQSELMPPGVTPSPTTTKSSESRRHSAGRHSSRRTPDERREATPPPSRDEGRGRDRSSSRRGRGESRSTSKDESVDVKDRKVEKVKEVEKVEKAKRREKRDKTKKKETGEEKKTVEAASSPTEKDSSLPSAIQRSSGRKRRKHAEDTADDVGQKSTKMMKHRRHSKREKSNERVGDVKEVLATTVGRGESSNEKDAVQEEPPKRVVAEKEAGDDRTQTETGVVSGERNLALESMDFGEADSSSLAADECGPRLPPTSASARDKVGENGRDKAATPADYPTSKWKPLPEVSDKDRERAEDTGDSPTKGHGPEPKPISPPTNTSPIVRARKTAKKVDAEPVSKMGVINQLDSRPSLDDGDGEGKNEKGAHHRRHKKKKTSKHQSKHSREHRKSREDDGNASGDRSRKHSRRSISGERRKREDGSRMKSSKSLVADRSVEGGVEGNDKHSARKRSHKKHSRRENSRQRNSSEYRRTSRGREGPDGDRANKAPQPYNHTSPVAENKKSSCGQGVDAESSSTRMDVRRLGRKNSRVDARSGTVPVVVTIPHL